MINPGTRVSMNSPNSTHRLERGLEGGARIVVPNGSKGTVVGSAPESQSVMVCFDDIGGSVGVSVRVKWLEMTP